MKFLITFLQRLSDGYSDQGIEQVLAWMIPHTRTRTLSIPHLIPYHATNVCYTHIITVHTVEICYSTYWQAHTTYIASSLIHMGKVDPNKKSSFEFGSKRIASTAFTQESSLLHDLTLVGNVNHDCCLNALLQLSLGGVLSLQTRSSCSWFATHKVLFCHFIA